jgi:hypothetical protein
MAVTATTSSSEAAAPIECSPARAMTRFAPMMASRMISLIGGKGTDKFRADAGDTRKSVEQAAGSACDP